MNFECVTQLSWVSSERVVSFMFCAGINNFIEKEYLGHQGSVFKPSCLSAFVFIESLADIKSKLKARFPNSKVAFGKITPVYFGHLQEFRLELGLLQEPKYTADELAIFNDQVSAKLTLVNSEIVVLNKLERVWSLKKVGWSGGAMVQTGCRTKDP